MLVKGVTGNHNASTLAVVSEHKMSSIESMADFDLYTLWMQKNLLREKSTIP